MVFVIRVPNGIREPQFSKGVKNIDNRGDIQ